MTRRRSLYDRYDDPYSYTQYHVQPLQAVPAPLAGTKDNKKCGRFAAVVLLILLWGLIFLFFGPKKMASTSSIDIICGLAAVVSVVLAVALASWGNDVFLLGILIHVCMFCGVLTLTHCVVYSHPQDLHPYDDVGIPKDLRSNLTYAGTNALICFTKHSRMDNFNEFLADELKDTGGWLMHRWGIAFSSAISPIVPLMLGVINYWMLWNRSMIVWDLVSILALDIIDCITMFDTIFAHDPYFLFEDAGHVFMWIFVVSLYLCWNIATFQLSMELSHRSKPHGADTGENTFPGLTSWILNALFFTLRCILRAKAMFCVPLLLLKNLYFLVDIPLEVIRQRDPMASGPDSRSSEANSLIDPHSADASIDVVKHKLSNLREIIRAIKHGTDEQYEVRHGYGYSRESPAALARIQFDKALHDIKLLQGKLERFIDDERRKPPHQVNGDMISLEQQTLREIDLVHNDIRDFDTFFRKVDDMICNFRVKLYNIDDIDHYFRYIEDMLYTIKVQSKQ